MGGIEREGVPIRRRFPFWAVSCPFRLPCPSGAIDGGSSPLASWETETPSAFADPSAQSWGARGFSSGLAGEQNRRHAD
jgi:hypothetical protein